MDNREYNKREDNNLSAGGNLVCRFDNGNMMILLFSFLNELKGEIRR